MFLQYNGTYAFCMQVQKPAAYKHRLKIFSNPRLHYWMNVNVVYGLYYPIMRVLYRIL